MSLSPVEKIQEDRGTHQATRRNGTGVMGTLVKRQQVKFYHTDIVFINQDFPLLIKNIRC